jgi:hypothetical protein
VSVGSRLQGCGIFVLGAVAVLVAIVLAFVTVLPLSSYLPRAVDRAAQQQVHDAVRRGAEAYGALAESSTAPELERSLDGNRTGMGTSILGRSFAQLDAREFLAGEPIVYEIDAEALTVTIIALGHSQDLGWASGDASVYACAELTAKPGSPDVRIETVECEEPVLSGIAAHWGDPTSAT